MISWCTALLGQLTCLTCGPVLSVLCEERLVANKKKCSFAQLSVEYLGHIISHEGVAMNPAKVSCVLNWPVPKTVKGVRGFLGLTGGIMGSWPSPSRK